MKKILVWDLPTRVGHWLLASAFVVAWITGDSEELRLFHVSAGYVMAAVLSFRVFWGVAGTRYARFSSFLFSPRQLVAYLSSQVKGKPARWVGHNPAGSYAIYLLLLLGLGVVTSGWMAYNETGGDWLEEAHDILSDAMLFLVGLHVSGVVLSSMLHRENLVRSMLTGYKHGHWPQGIASARRWWAVLLAGLAAGAGWLAFAG
ncbi:MAG: cytochrome B [Sideroxydans sp.]|nr:cytochrome B [Sideroxydans sp.]